MEPYLTREDLTLLCQMYGIPEMKAQMRLPTACDEIDALCYGRIRRIGFDRLTSFQQEKVKKAVAAHLVFLIRYGDLVHNPLQSYGINGVSMTFDASRLETQGGVTTSSEAMAQLRQSGLAVRLIP